MRPLNRTTASRPALLPIRIMQIGEGNFLRAFADWAIDLLNEKEGFDAGVAVIQPTPRGNTDIHRAQQGLYHHQMRGIHQGRKTDSIRLISCIQEVINPYENPMDYFVLAQNPQLQMVISNTTEAGIRFEEEPLPEVGNM
ncbi:MAG: tagaturonate reductase, partial [Cyclobacteriaceae bacterium]|nr:tagaturonate reductase [Cyclobacteriaceae bacterium]